MFTRFSTVLPALAATLLTVVSASPNCAIGGSADTVMAGQQLYLDPSDSGYFTPTFTFTNCNAETDSDGNTIDSDSYPAALIDGTTGNSYDCGPNPGTVTLDGSPFMVSYKCRVVKSDMTDGPWTFIATGDSTTIAYGTVQFSITHSNQPSTVTVVQPSATSKVLVVKFPDGCCPNTAAAIKRDMASRPEPATFYKAKRAITVTQTVTSGVATMPLATISPIQYCPKLAGPNLAAWVKLQLNLVKLANPGKILVVCGGQSVLY